MKKNQWLFFMIGLMIADINLIIFTYVERYLSQ